MLINLSHHEYETWKPNQKDLAIKLYGKVIDMPFPNIDPTWDRTKVEELASDYLQKIVVQNPVAIHIMGELSFVFNIVQLLKQKNIKCILSTTKRNVTFEGDKKIVIFNFVNFREY